MIKFGNLIIEGFCSISYYETSLAQNGITIIRGRNGVGKSSFLAAINWVLYGKHTKEDVTNVNTWEKFRTKEYQGTKVSIYYESQNSIYNVIRCSNYTGQVNGTKGKNRLILMVDGQEVDEKKKGDIQALIVKSLGMSQKLFLNSIMFGQGLKRLVQETGSDKKNLFEEVFDVTYLSSAKKLAQDRMKNISIDLSQLRLDIERLSNSLDGYKASKKELVNNLNSFNQELKLEVDNIKSKLKLARETFAKASERFNQNLLAKSMDKKAVLMKDLQELQDDYNNNAHKIQEVTRTEGLNNLIEELISLLDKGNTLKAKSRLKYLHKAIQAVNNYRETKDSLLSKKEKLVDIINEQKSISLKLESQKNAIETLKEQLSDTKNRKPPVNTGIYDKKMDDLELKLSPLKPQLENLQRTYNNYKWVIDNPLGNKGIKSYIFESSLGKLNEVLSSYANVLGFHIEFSVDLESTKKDFYTLIEMEGNIVDYSELSGGQKQLVHIAMAFAMHVTTTSSKGINILFLDEIFEHLDYENVEIIVSLIRKMSGTNKSIYIITHQSSLPISNSRTLALDRKKGQTIFS